MILTAVALLIVTPLLTTPLILISLFTKSGGAVFRIAVWWAWIVHKCMGLTFSLEGAEKVKEGTSYIVTPNHQGNADILALFATLPLRFRWVIKKELLRIPVFGWALAGTGAISLDRSNREKSIRSLKNAKKKLAGGWSVLIYPEGTRSSNPNLQPFKKGAFMMAVQTGVPILPVTCNGAYRVLPRKTISFMPGHITVTIGDPIQTQGLTEQDVPDLMERTRNEIAKSLDPDYNPFDVHKQQPSPPAKKIEYTTKTRRHQAEQ